MKKRDFVVTPWEVSGEVDYQKLIERFGTQPIDEKLLRRIQKHVSELPPMLRRNIFYSHRDLDWILDKYEKGAPFVLYTGRGPSGHTHLGHLMPWIFTKWLQDKFGAELYFQLTDDEKFLFKDELSLNDTKNYAYDNALDFIALGFDAKKTHIFTDTEYIKTLYPLALKVAKKITFSTAKAVFGFNNDNNIGSIFFTSMQSAPSFIASERAGKNVPCLIPCAIDQDPHFRVTRDVADSLGYCKPALIHCKMLPSLAGSDKMSASKPETSIFTTDTIKVARKKIMNAFTGGAATVEEQRKKGGNPDVCSVYQYLFYFFEGDDTKINDIAKACKSGELLCGECKKNLAAKIETFLVEHQKKREEAKKKMEKFILRD